MLGAATALAQLPALLDAKGLLEDARAQSSDIVVDTFSGLAAFILPGDDPYSAAQGQAASSPGGVGSGAVPALIANLDDYVPLAALGPGATLPASGGVASLLNAYAQQVNPGASNGGFASPFARLSFEEKGEVFKRIESDPTYDGTEFKFVGGILPGFIGFLIHSEVGVLDPAKRELTGTPVSWTISGFGGPAEGHAELKGYWRGHMAAVKSDRVKRWERIRARLRRKPRRRRPRRRGRRRRG
jgi:hypothetical protein